jgi:outer membrane protein assembly factor BamE (lipoprotein component of BamABCDE complex)
MLSLKLVDRIAVIAMFSVMGIVPLAAHASYSSRLNDDTFKAIQVGMTAAEVVARIGPPDSRERFERTKTTAWDYRFRDAWGYDADFAVIVDDAGVVSGKVTVRNGN